MSKTFVQLLVCCVPADYVICSLVMKIIDAPPPENSGVSWRRNMRDSETFHNLQFIHHVRKMTGKTTRWLYCVECLQYSIRLEAVRSVHKQFTSCIRWCLVSRACDLVMSALSAVYTAFLPCRSARRHSGVLGLPNIGHRPFPKIWLFFLYGAYSPGNDFE